MNSALTYTTTTSSPAASSKLAEQIAKQLTGGETIELSSDLGGGKTTFAQGLAKGLGYDGPIVSPTFTVSRVYQLPGSRQLHHFDFYRLSPGDVAASELAEAAGQPNNITIVEWASQAGDVLPPDRLTIKIEVNGESSRQFTITGGPSYQKLIASLK